MNTAIVIGSSYPGSSERTASLLFQPTFKENRKSDAAIVPFSVSKAHAERLGARLRISKPAVWEWLELGFVFVLGSSVLASVLLALIAAAKM
jgi:hypothetical protein